VARGVAWHRLCCLNRAERRRSRVMSQLPFSRSEFLQVLARYNAEFWPVAIALWAASLVAAVSILRNGRLSDRSISGLLAVHWSWSGVVYHAGYFTAINPAAWVFAAAFVTQAMLLVRSGVVQRQLQYDAGRSARHRLAAALMIYALAYPFISLLDLPSDGSWSWTSAGLAIPAPLFAVPCPTTLFTAGLLLSAKRLPLSLAMIPVAWSCIGGSAALLLGVRADFALFAAAAMLLWYALAARARLVAAT